MLLLPALACAPKPVPPPQAPADSPYVVVQLGHGPAYVPGASGEIADVLGSCGSTVLAAQKAAWAASRNVADHTGVNCSVPQAAAWIEDRLAQIDQAERDHRPDLVPGLLAEAIDAAQSVAFQSNLVETLAPLVTLDDLSREDGAFWHADYSPSPATLRSQFRSEAAPDRCTPQRPELAKHTPTASLAASAKVAPWGLSGNAAARRLAGLTTEAVIKDAVRVAPTWAGSCESYLVATIMEEDP